MSTPILTDADRERIRVAVGQAETQTSGEIVPYITHRSGVYEVALWRAGVLGAVCAGLVGMLIMWMYDGWGLGWLYSAWGMAFVMSLGGALLATITAFVGSLRRALAGSGRLAERVHRRAEAAFFEEEVFNTRDRTGILLFISLFEHRIEVIGDVGINKAVKLDEWEEVVHRVRRGIKQGKFADGLIDAIAMCGELLQRRGVGVRDDDVDELSDDVRIRAE